ncbi:MAG: OsmC family protein [Candidatus Dormibacteraceae bacterium]
MATVTVRNGINVDQLVGTIGAIQKEPGLGDMTFKAKTTWKEGTNSVTEIGPFVHAGKHDDSRHTAQFKLRGDEPPVLLGRNLGPNAVEFCLAALGFCYAVGFVANAAAKGFELEELSYEVEGDIDLHAFLGLGKGRPGFTEIRVKSRVKSRNASREDLESLCQYVQDTSPVRDILANPVPVKTDLEVV